ncbi:MAG: hypothetical protein H8E17_03870 [Deltaproteobacteria bacterium]|nr:hypothetical protein [Deltaproteobacteria bacterium]
MAERTPDPMILLVCIGAIQPESEKSWQFPGQYQKPTIAKAPPSDPTDTTQRQ